MDTKPCPKCGSLEDKYVGYAQCKKCRRQYQRQYRKQNHAKVLATNRRYHEHQRYNGSRKVIIQQLGGKCIDCGTDKRLCLHHVDGNGPRKGHYQTTNPYPNNDISNLTVLCVHCHGSLHGKEGGKMNYGRGRF